jgi:hypothetical protein
MVEYDKKIRPQGDNLERELRTAWIALIFSGPVATTDVALIKERYHYVSCN